MLGKRSSWLRPVLSMKMSGYVLHGLPVTTRTAIIVGVATMSLAGFICLHWPRSKGPMIAIASCLVEATLSGDAQPLRRYMCETERKMNPDVNQHLESIVDEVRQSLRPYERLDREGVSSGRLGNFAMSSRLLGASDGTRISCLFSVYNTEYGLRSNVLNVLIDTWVLAKYMPKYSAAPLSALRARSEGYRAAKSVFQPFGINGFVVDLAYERYMTWDEVIAHFDESLAAEKKSYERKWLLDDRRGLGKP
jgi:hypothetical protein